MTILLIFIIILITYIYLKLRTCYQYWTTIGVFQIGTWPLVGNLGPLVFRTQSFTEIVQNVYDAVPQKRYYGMYRFFNPTLIIRCPNLIKTIMIKEFTTFPQHLTTLPPEVDPLFSNNLFSMNGGQRWHDLRSILSPSFTANKLKYMFGLIHQCATQFTEHFERHEGRIIIEMKDVFSRYTNDVIGTTAFGVTCDSFRNPDNKFYLIGKEITNITAWKIFKLLITCISPMLVKILKIHIVSMEANLFLHSIISENIKLREKQKTIRPDMINLLIEARKAKPEIVLTDEDITAQAFVFFIAGFETSSTAMCFTSYELALNPDIQMKLQGEIDSVLEYGEITYEKLLEMKYMDMVVSESLRKWPPIILSDRKSIRPFVLNSENEEETNIHLDTGTEVWIPIFGLHRDPQYYPEPDKFVPERFSDSNKHNILQFTYLPFGAGPKNCIGSRLALLEVKLILFYVLRKFDILITEKTPIPIILDTNQFFPTPKGGFWLELRPRENR